MNEHFPYIFVITNQGGIGLGYMKESQLHKIHDHMIAQLKKEVQQYMMLLTAHINQKQVMSEERRSQSLIIGKKYNIDLSKSYMVGDTDTDIQAGKKLVQRVFSWVKAIHSLMLFSRILFQR
ncbi:HAD hydrolase-like protein [Neobacillus cucumis]|uniref:HAD hydrolase-like protein n=1 Tax=Neobacillus cucumis TaxID=1740721 RepID=UPI0019637EC8|nr:HAD hydrolase-like protein [Neobacillus cucumis]MBM7651373.1 histidinol phosphatase-like enzyme [Neobacillus cucumis]